MNLGQTFNVADLPEGGSFEPLKAGWYQVVIDKAEVRATKAGTGSYINVTYKVTGSESNGRIVFGMITLKNPTPTAEDIGRQNLGDLCRAIGIANIQDSDQLIGGPLEIKLTVKKDEEYGDKNEVKGYRKISGAAPIPSATPTGPIGGPATAPPWGRQ